MINEFNYLTLEELHLIVYKYSKHLHVVQKYKIMRAIENWSSYMKPRPHKITKEIHSEIVNYSTKHICGNSNSKVEVVHM
jgi:hypothetical protein